MPRAGSFWPAASVHAMYMHMHMRTLWSLIAFLCCSGGPARAVHVAGRRRPGVGLCTSSAHTQPMARTEAGHMHMQGSVCNRPHAPRLSGCFCSISSSATLPWATTHASARSAQQIRLTAASRLRDRALQPEPGASSVPSRPSAPRRPGVRGGPSPTASTVVADADDAPAQPRRVERLAPAPSAIVHARDLRAQNERERSAVQSSPRDEGARAARWQAHSGCAWRSTSSDD